MGEYCSKNAGDSNNRRNAEAIVRDQNNQILVLGGRKGNLQNLNGKEIDLESSFDGQEQVQNYVQQFQFHKWHINEFIEVLNQVPGDDYLDAKDLIERLQIKYSTKDQEIELEKILNELPGSNNEGLI